MAPRSQAPLTGSKERSLLTDRAERPSHRGRVGVEQRFGIDLADVRVHRGPESAQVARRLRAQAFTAAGEVHVPLDVGTLESGRGRALLTHELVHVAQQRRLAQHPLAEGSELGQSLESEAQALAPTDRARFDQEPRTDTRDPGWGRGDADPTTDLARLQHGGRAGSGGDEPILVGPAHPVPQVRSVQRAPDAEQAAGSTRSEPSLDNVLDRLYDSFCTRLRAELLIDRERAGWLNDL